MKSILVVGEDMLCCTLAERLVAATLMGWQLACDPIDKKGITNLVPDLKRYVQFAEGGRPVLCLADTDRRCAKKLVHDWLPLTVPQAFMLRLAVEEAESWVLADRYGFSEAFQVPISKVPHAPDEEGDPKQLVLNLAARSKNRRFREEVVSSGNPRKRGSGYNLHLCSFVRSNWDVFRARQSSPSLDRALCRLEAFNALND